MPVGSILNLQTPAHISSPAGLTLLPTLFGCDVGYTTTLGHDHRTVVHGVPFALGSQPHHVFINYSASQIDEWLSVKDLKWFLATWLGKPIYVITVWKTRNCVPLHPSFLWSTWSCPRGWPASDYLPWICDDKFMNKSSATWRHGLAWSWRMDGRPTKSSVVFCQT